MLFRLAVVLFFFGVTISEGKASAVFERALEHFKAGKFQQAADLFQEGLRTKEDGLARYYLAESWRKLGRADDHVLDQYRKASAANPESLEAGYAKESMRLLQGVLARKQQTLQLARSAEGRDYVALVKYASGSSALICFRFPAAGSRQAINFGALPTSGNIAIKEYLDKTPSKYDLEFQDVRAIWFNDVIKIALPTPNYHHMKYRFLSDIWIGPSDIRGLSRAASNWIAFREDASGRCKSGNPW